MPSCVTAAKPLGNACPVRTTLECRPSTRTATDGPGRSAYSYGLEVVAAACPMRWSTGAYDGHSRTTPQASRSGLTHVSRVAQET